MFFIIFVRLGLIPALFYFHIQHNAPYYDDVNVTLLSGIWKGCSNSKMSSVFWLIQWLYIKINKSVISTLYGYILNCVL